MDGEVDIGEEDIVAVVIITGLITLMIGLIGITAIVGPHGTTQMQDTPEIVLRTVITDTKVVLMVEEM